MVLRHKNPKPVKTFVRGNGLTNLTGAARCIHHPSADFLIAGVRAMKSTGAESFPLDPTVQQEKPTT